VTLRPLDPQAALHHGRIAANRCRLCPPVSAFVATHCNSWYASNLVMASCRVCRRNAPNTSNDVTDALAVEPRQFDQNQGCPVIARGRRSGRAQRELDSDGPERKLDLISQSSSSLPPCLDVGPTVGEKGLVPGERIDRLDAGEMPMIALARFVVVPQHALARDDQRQTTISTKASSARVYQHLSAHGRRPLALGTHPPGSSTHPRPRRERHQSLPGWPARNAPPIGRRVQSDCVLGMRVSAMRVA